MNIRTWWAALLLAFSCASAHAAFIVDTGANAGGPGWSFFPGQFFGGEFTTGTAQTVNSVEGFYSNEGGGGGEVTISLHADGGNIPGSVLYSTSHALGPSAPLDWYGVFGLDWVIGAGTYWVSFAPDGVGISGTHPGSAPNPMSEYAQHSGGGWQDQGPNFFDYLDVGIRIDAGPRGAVPEPGTLALLGLAGAALGWTHRRRRTGILSQ